VIFSRQKRLDLFLETESAPEIRLLHTLRIGEMEAPAKRMLSCCGT
jgi:hypothetical protein